MKIILKGDFYDCQIIHGRVFLWNTWGQLFVFDIRPIIDQCVKDAGGKDTVLEIEKNHLMHFCVASVNVKGGIFPLDSAYMDNHLYSATESGLYKRYIQVGKRISDFSKGRAFPISRIPFYNIAIGDGYMGLAGKEEGLFELYNEKRYRISKYGRPAKMAGKGIYSVHRDYSSYVWYEKRNLFSRNERGYSYEYLYRLSQKSDNTGKYLRTYYKRLEDLRYNSSSIMMLPSPEPSKQIIDHKEKDSKPLLNEYKIRSITPKLDPQKTEFSFITKDLDVSISIGSKPRRSFKANYGIVVESKKEVVIVRPNGEVIRIPGPVTRTRNAKDSFGRDYLIVVLNDNVLIDDLKNIKNDF